MEDRNISCYVQEYYNNNAKKLRDIVNQIILRKRFTWINDMEHFYSLANYVFVHDVIPNYNEANGSFKAWLYCCLEKKIISEVTRSNREKRKADRNSISIDSPINEDGNMTIGDTIASVYNLEDEIFTENESKIERYLERLSKVQRKIVELLLEGYKSFEIQEQLHISYREYSKHMEEIHAYKNVSILF